MVKDKEIFKLSSEDFKKALDKFTDSELIQFFHDMSPSQRKKFLNNLTNEEIIFYRSKLPKKEKERFMNRLLEDGKKLFWENERKLVEQGKGTRNWTPEQQKLILERKTPLDINNKNDPFEAHHMLSKEDNPKFASDPENFQALSKRKEPLSTT